MNTILENRISMYYKVREFFSNHLGTLVATAPALTAVNTVFNTKLSELDALLIIADETTSGYATQKQNNRDVMQNLAMSISGALFAHAKSVGNEPLAAKAYITISALSQKRDTDVLYWCDRLFDLATANAAALVPLGITGPILANYNTSISTFKNSIQDPADKRSEGKAAFIEANKKTEEINNHLQIIDGVMLAINSSHSLLYNQYKADRLIDDNTGGSSSPDVIEIVEAGATESIYAVPYSASRSFKLKNNSAEELFWGLSDDALNPTTPLRSISANSTSNVNSETLAPSGEFLLVNNPSAVSVTVELTIIE